MTDQSKWKIIPVSADSDGRLFFDEHQWATIEAATARIIPTDRDPGAREAKVVRFIDRYISGIDYIYASADGSGFLKMEGKDSEAWTERIQLMRNKYTDGVNQLDEVGREKFGKAFIALTEEQQDEVLLALSGEPMPQRVLIGGQTQDTGPSDGAPSSNLPVSDEGHDFFRTLIFHTRMGFYSDPAYGGNADHVGWKVIGFPGPKSLAETRDGRYTTKSYLYMDTQWPYSKNIPDGTSSPE